MPHREEAAPAKVNLFLHVTGRRADGYHLLDSLAVFGPPADLLTASPADDLTLTLDGPFGATLAAEPDNLVLRAARALAATAGVPSRAALVLHKHLPVASGIGGWHAAASAAAPCSCWPPFAFRCCLVGAASTTFFLHIQPRLELRGAPAPPPV